MIFQVHILRTHKQLLVLLLWVAYVGFSLWQHAQQSLQPPIHDASQYFLKAYNFWSNVKLQKIFNPFNVEPSIRPPGTVLMSYPFGFDIDYRGFYFRSIFLPIVLFVLATVIGGYRRELDYRCKWHLALFAAFFTSMPCYYGFEATSRLETATIWGLADYFLAGVAALATAVTIRSVLTRSVVWLSLSAILSSFCLLIKPTGVFVMMLNGLVWFGLTVLKLRLVWFSLPERKCIVRWLLLGMVIVIFAFSAVLVSSVTSNYLSTQNQAYGTASLAVLESDHPLSWDALLAAIHLGIGYPFVVWLFLMITVIGKHLCRMRRNVLPTVKLLHIGLVIVSCLTLVFGVWFWLIGSNGVSQVRYFIPFLLMSVILALPVILAAVGEMSSWKLAILTIIMVTPIINMSLLLPQRDAPIEWQKLSGVNLTSGIFDPVISQAQDFASRAKQEGHPITLYSMSLMMADATFDSVLAYEKIVDPSMPTVSFIRPLDWRHPTAFRKEEMLDTDYWLFEPVLDPKSVSASLSTAAIDDLGQETALFQVWATQLTPNDGVEVVSATPVARLLRITDPIRLEASFDALVAKHQWRSIFINENRKRRFNENELAAELTLNPPSLEHIDFGNLFRLRALSVRHIGNEVTVYFWWKPLLTISQQDDWYFFVHIIDDEDKNVGNEATMIHYNRPLSSLDSVFLFDKFTFKITSGSGTKRLGVGFYRPNQEIPLADKGTRDWGNRRVIVPLP